MLASPNYVTDYPVPKRDVAKAKALLKEAGIEKPSITLMVYANNDAPQVGQVIQAMTREAGFDVKLQATDFTTSSTRPTRAVSRPISTTGAAGPTRTATPTASSPARCR